MNLAYSRHVGRSAVLINMLKAFGALDNRLHAQGRRCFEPSGQDGYNCLLAST